MPDSQRTSIARARNRFRFVVFGVGAALALVIYSGSEWVRAQMQWKSKRADAIAWMESQAAFWSDLSVDQQPNFDATAPTAIKFLGAPGLRGVCVVVANKGDVDTKQDELQALFPEATEILVVSPGPGYAGRRAHLVNN